MTGDPGDAAVRVARLDGVGDEADAAAVAQLDAPLAAAPTVSADADFTGLGDAIGDVARIASFDPGEGQGRVVARVAVFDGRQASTARNGAPVVNTSTGTPGPGRRGSGRRSGEGTDRERSRPTRRAPGEIDPDTDPVAAAREICLRMLTDRARTRHELAQALGRKGVPEEAADTVLERFDEVGLIDDAAFAGQWVRARQASRGLARRAIALELRRKGVDDEVAGEALAVVDPESEERRARQLVERKLRSLTVDTTEQRATAVRRLVGMLARKGYGGHIAYRVVREALAADPDELGPELADA